MTVKTTIDKHKDSGVYVCSVVYYTLTSKIRIPVDALPTMTQLSEEASFERIHHTTIGSIQGLKRSEQVTQYLGVQYATLKDRFTRAELIDTYIQSEVLDATTFG